MDALSPQTKRKRKPLDPNLSAVIFSLLGIFYIIVDGPDVWLYLLKDAGLDSLLAEKMAAWAAVLWLGLMVLLARYANKLFQAILWLFMFALFGVLIYHIATFRSTDEMRDAIQGVVFGFTFLTGAPYLWFLYKPAEQANQAARELGA